jgi:hypothetical protein
MVFPVFYPMFDGIKSTICTLIEGVVLGMKGQYMRFRQDFDIGQILQVFWPETLS